MQLTVPLVDKEANGPRPLEQQTAVAEGHNTELVKQENDHVAEEGPTER